MITIAIVLVMPSDAPSLALQSALTLLARHDVPAMLDLARVVKSCGCGRRYDAPGWEALANPRLWRFDGETLELRDCACGSSIAVEVRS